jgi:glycosyltransferase involved in cell wall biosynthesis
MDAWDSPVLPSRPRQTNAPFLPTWSSQSCISESWDFIESVSWANAATNLDVLTAMKPETRLLFTPHTQPMWTLINPEQYFMVMPVFRQMLERSDAVFTDAPNELHDLNLSTTVRQRAIYISPGVDTETFCYAQEEPATRQVLCVCDFREPRKRIDLLFRAFGEVARQDRGISLTIAGNQSDKYPIPPTIADRVTRLGYVTTNELVRLYRQCGGFALLSDYEAFGIPIAEALCCGTPVLINKQPQLEAIFAHLPGVRLVGNDETSSVAAAMLEIMLEPPDRRIIASSATKTFGLAATCVRKLRHVQSLMV